MNESLIHNSPRISVAMSVYNGEKYVAEAVQSVLNQTYKDFELIIVDDGSTDKSVRIIESFEDTRIRLIRQENRGLSAALNVCIKQAKGEYIARMDADDICQPDRFQLQLNYMEEHLDCVLLSSSIEYIDKDGSSLCTKKIATDDHIIKQNLPLTCQIIHPAAFFRKVDFQKTAGYREEVIQHVEDILLWNEFAKLGKFSNIETPLLKYRLCPGSISGYNRFIRRKKQSILLKVVRNEKPTQKDLDFLNSLSKQSPQEKRSRYFYQIANMHASQGRFREGAKNFTLSLKEHVTLVSFLGYIKCTLKSFTQCLSN